MGAPCGRMLMALSGLFPLFSGNAVAETQGIGGFSVSILSIESGIAHSLEAACAGVAAELRLDLVSVVAADSDRRFVRELAAYPPHPAAGGGVPGKASEAGIDLVGAFPDGIAYLPAAAPTAAAQALAVAGFQHGWAAPLWSQGFNLGLVNVATRRPDGFAPEQLERLRAFRAAVAALVGHWAVERRRQLREARRDVVAALARLPGPGETIGSLFDGALECLAHAVQAQYVQLSVRDGETMRVASATSSVYRGVGEAYPADVSPTGLPLAQSGALRQYRPDRMKGPWSQAFWAAGIGQVAVIALRDGEQLLGSVTVGRREQVPFSDTETAFLDIVRALTRQALSTVGQLREAEITALRNGTVTQLAILLHSVADPEALFSHLAAQLPAALGATFISLFIRKPGEEDLTVVGAAPGTLFRPGDCLPLAALPVPASEGPRVVQQYRVDDLPFGLKRSLLDVGMAQGATAPLFDGDDLVGLLNVGRERTVPFAETELDVLEVIGTLIAQSLGKARRDATAESQRLQAEQTARLAALGELVAGVAHELNNPLTAVMGYTELVLPAARAAGFGDDLETVFQEALRARDIVHGLLFFARPDRSERVSVNVNDVVAHVEHLRRPAWQQSGIEGVVIADSGPVFVAGSAEQLAQVLLNLVINAEHALSGVSDPRIRIATSVERQACQIVITDNGVGMDEATRLKVFQPFFTTKTRTGTGLGLSISHSIVTAHHGKIGVDSRPGKGTTFRISLPLADPALDEPEEAVKTPTPTLNVLIIDDEESVRAVTMRMVETLGHRSRAACDKQSALACLQQAPADVVVCDYRLGEQTADGLLAELLARYPGLERRVILCTGATTDRGVEELVERQRLGLLAKPYAKADLARALNAIFAT